MLDRRIFDPIFTLKLSSKHCEIYFLWGYNMNLLRTKYVFDKSSSNNINFKNGFLFIALVFQVISTIWIFIRIWKSWYRWKPTAERNITMEIISEKRRIKIKKTKMNIFNFFCKIATDCKFWSRKLSCSWKCKFYFWYIPGLPLCQEWRFECKIKA